MSVSSFVMMTVLLFCQYGQWAVAVDQHGEGGLDAAWTRAKRAILVPLKKDCDCSIESQVSPYCSHVFCASYDDVQW
jgi:hypothetical protein